MRQRDNKHLTYPDKLVEIDRTYEYLGYGDIECVDILDDISTISNYLSERGCPVKHGQDISDNDDQIYWALLYDN